MKSTSPDIQVKHVFDEELSALFENAGIKKHSDKIKAAKMLIKLKLACCDLEFYKTNDVLTPHLEYYMEEDFERFMNGSEPEDADDETECECSCSCGCRCTCDDE